MKDQKQHSPGACARGDARVELHPPRRTVALALIGAFLAVGIVTSACDAGTPGGDDKRSTKVPELSAEAEKELSFSGSKLAVVFAIDGNGRIQAYRRRGTEVVPFALPIKADKVTAMLGISVIRTENPKTCWRDTTGGERCITW